jgi:hypothetical protein
VTQSLELEDRDRANSTLSKGNTLNPTINNNIKMIRMEKEEGWYLFIAFKKFKFDSDFLLKHTLNNHPLDVI